MKKYIFKIAAMLALIIMLFPFYAGAQNLRNAFGPNSQLDASADKAGYDNSKYQIQPIISDIIKAFLGIIGIIFLILMILAGYNWMTAHGDEQKVTKAKDTITASIIGLIIVLGAYAITFFVVSKLSESTLR